MSHLTFPDSAEASESDNVSLPCCKTAGRPRAIDQEARMQDLLATAAKLFLEHGYGNVSLETIARQAHVAVRTIYVKFGGKAGLLNAVIAGGRARYFSTMDDMDTDARPLEHILSDFGLRFLQLISMPAAVNLQRMVIAEAKTNPELAATFHRAGPGQTRELLGRFFARPDIATRFRAELAPDALALHLINCITGDQLARLLFEAQPTEAELQNQVAQGLDFFFRATLRC